MKVSDDREFVNSHRKILSRSVLFAYLSQRNDISFYKPVWPATKNIISKFNIGIKNDSPNVCAACFMSVFKFNSSYNSTLYPRYTLLLLTMMHLMR